MLLKAAARPMHKQKERDITALPALAMETKPRNSRPPRSTWSIRWQKMHISNISRTEMGPRKEIKNSWELMSVHYRCQDLRNSWVVGKMEERKIRSLEDLPQEPLAGMASRPQRLCNIRCNEQLQWSLRHRSSAQEALFPLCISR